MGDDNFAAVRERVDPVALVEDERFAWYFDAFPPLTNWYRTPYWVAEESTFEEARRDDLKEWAGRLSDPGSDCFWAARHMEMLTDTDLTPERKPEERILDYRDRVGPLLRDRWMTWYAANALDLKWDWGRGHFAVRDQR